MEVRTAARAVTSNWQRVQSTRAARVLAARRLDAEEKKFSAGMSTNFLVTQSQRDLALADVSELQATSDYRKSIVNFERVQEAGGGSAIASAVRTTAASSAPSTTAAASSGSAAAGSASASGSATP
jgi:outer membrane protein TolC